jgi:hypothetical protein
MTKRPKKTEFPKKIYCVYGGDDDYRVSDKSPPFDLAEDGEKPCAEFRLVRVGVLSRMSAVEWRPADRGIK